MVYVLLSRVRCWDDIRILQNYDANPSSLAHLLLLRNDRDSTIVRWLAAFDDETLLHGAAGARFDMERLRRYDATLGPRPNARRASKARTGANAFLPDSWYWCRYCVPPGATLTSVMLTLRAWQSERQKLCRPVLGHA